MDCDLVRKYFDTKRFSKRERGGPYEQPVLRGWGGGGGGGVQKVSDPQFSHFVHSEMPFKSDEKSGKVGRIFPNFDF